ncbi:MAG TPA: hypothetical protein VHZ98_16155 [Galbitalea sp.]|jgi:hypothetical protein|nr:hypothetical protein [Galbitalea sp.]
MFSTQRRVKTARIRGVLALAAVGALAIGAISSAGPAFATAQTVTVNLASTSGTATGIGAGFLYGYSQDGSAPDDSLLTPLGVTSGRGGGARLAGDGWIGDGYVAGAGYRARIASAIAQAKRITSQPTPATYDLLVSDLFGADTTQSGSTVYPCANGDCTNWITFIDQVVGDISASGVSVRYDIWNEPNSGDFWGAGYESTQYYAMWDSAVREIRRLVPTATIVGPSVGFNTTDISTFLTHVKAAGTVPNVLNWHFGDNPITDAQTARSLLAAQGISGVSLTINEYDASTPWYLAELGKSGLASATQAIWGSCCMVPSLDGILNQNSSGVYRPSGNWWVFKDYADVTGNLASVTASGTTDAIAGVDQSRGRVAMLLGDSAGNTGPVTLAINGLSSDSWLFGGTGALLTVQRVPNDGSLDQPPVVSSQVITSGTSSVSVPINWIDGSDAYFVEITPITTTTASVDGAATSPAPNYFQYGTSWGQSNGISDMQAGTANWSYSAGSTAELHFTGSQVDLRAVRDSDQGQMAVSVDGSIPLTVDDYAATRSASAVVWTSPALSPGTHVMVVTVLGTKNGSSSGTNIALDGADVVPITSTDVPVDDTVVSGSSNYFQYGSNWSEASGVSDLFNGTATYSPTTGSTATVHFTGNQLVLHAVKDVDQGIMSISVDGATPTTVDDYAATRNGSGAVWTSPFLTAGAHTVTITVTGTKNASSSGTTIALDRAGVLGALQSDANATTGVHFTYAGSGWGVTTGVSDMYAGTANWNSVAGSTATLTFTGTAIAVHAVRDTDQGKFTIAVDGGSPVIVDDYSSSRNASGIVWSSSTFAEGSHTIVITVTGTHNTSSTGNTVALDSVEILS